MSLAPGPTTVCEMEIEDSDGPDMREQIVEILLDALRKQGYPDMTRESIAAGGDHRRAFIEMLGDCRPLPVVLKLMEDARLGRI